MPRISPHRHHGARPAAPKVIRWPSQTTCPRSSVAIHSRSRSSLHTTSSGHLTAKSNSSLCKSHRSAAPGKAGSVKSLYVNSPQKRCHTASKRGGRHTALRLSWKVEVEPHKVALGSLSLASRKPPGISPMTICCIGSLQECGVSMAVPDVRTIAIFVRSASHMAGASSLSHLWRGRGVSSGGVWVS